MTDFIPFRKIGRLSRDMVITEKLDGTNGVIFVGEGDRPEFLVGSRSRWIPADTDNHGFRAWANDYRDDLIAALGPGWHHGEWWGQGIGRGYGLREKRFSLFNVSLWSEANPPAHCHVVPTLFTSPFSTEIASLVLGALKESGSIAAPGFMRPEGIVVYHAQANVLFKKTFEKDEAGKEHGA